MPICVSLSFSSTRIIGATTENTVRSARLRKQTRNRMPMKRAR